jgi:hypothetical protein
MTWKIGKHYLPGEFTGFRNNATAHVFNPDSLSLSSMAFYDLASIVYWARPSTAVIPVHQIRGPGKYEFATSKCVIRKGEYAAGNGGHGRCCSPLQRMSFD